MNNKKRLLFSIIFPCRSLMSFFKRSGFLNPISLNGMCKTFNLVEMVSFKNVLVVVLSREILRFCVSSQTCYVSYAQENRFQTESNKRNVTWQIVRSFFMSHPCHFINSSADFTPEKSKNGGHVQPRKSIS